MKWIIILFCLFSGTICTAQSFKTPYERSGGTKSASYKQLIAFYEDLDNTYRTIQMEEVGSTDAPYPLQVVFYSTDGHFDIKKWKASGKITVLINNGIHPGEPDGIDASMMLLRDAASGTIKIPDNVVLAVIPVFNIGGMLNRGSYSRANQNGPVEYGFRGNGQNLDLNRDFIKMDAKETQSLVALFHRLDPDLFIDNHVSNGADYQHIMTLLATQHNKLGGPMGDYLNHVLEPQVYLGMLKKGYNMVPYVNHWGHTPDSGWVAFHEGPRFASGFAALFHTYGFVPETHMLKPFKQRVDATYELMRIFIKLAGANADEIQRTRKEQKALNQEQQYVPIAWQSDTTNFSPITFDGYAAAYKPSEVSGEPRLYYDRSKPYSKAVKFYNTYITKQTVAAPAAYVIPHGWLKAINRLKTNGVKVQVLDKDSIMYLTAYHIDDYETVKRPYEGHYLHSNIKVKPQKQYIKLSKGDYIIPVSQPARRYIIEVLEPTAPDAFFAWGFFDAILQQKESYSDYVFEDEAAAILKMNKELRTELENKKRSDTDFAGNSDAQLDFIYKKSNYYEPGHMRYPVYRIEQ